MPGILNSITDAIGHTPLVRIQRLFPAFDGDVLAKLEGFNPTGSLKDRIGLEMIEAAKKSGHIRPNTVIVEPTSGNTGLALACVCAAQGLRLILTMPDSMSTERRQMLQLMGVEVVLTPANRGMQGAIDQAYAILRKEKNSFMPNQFQNPVNLQAHAETTAQEILEACEGALDVLVVGVGTGGTLAGIAQALLPTLPDLHVAAVEPDSSPVLSGGMPGHHGIQGIGAGFTPPILDTALIHSTVRVTEQQAVEMARACARKEGIACGLSSGAVLAAAQEMTQQSPFRGKRFVVVLADLAERYLSTDLFRAPQGSSKAP